jgi:HD-GYP domain-containing protein (c-di-GMP phosphodiesterase class II)
MIYSLITGMGMKYTTTQLFELGLSSLLQNIGMFLIPEEVINKNGRLTDYEIGLIKKHPEIGAEILQPFQMDYPWLLESVYQHHERENGQGYPRGLKGEEIIEYAKIIGICDCYEAMTHKRPHKQPITQFTSIKQLIESKEGLYSPQILKVFLESISLYPVGSYVILNNGAIGRVIETNKSNSMKPVIHLLFDGNGEKAPDGSIINLSESNVLNIASVISEKDLPSK